MRQNFQKLHEMLTSKRIRVALIAVTPNYTKLYYGRLRVMVPSEEYEEHASSIAIGTAETGISSISVWFFVFMERYEAEVPKLTEGMGLDAASVWVLVARWALRGMVS